MDRGILMALVILFGILLLALLPIGWRARHRRQRDLPALPVRPDQLGDVLGSYRGKYVATTVSGDPYDRVAARGLGFRGDAEVTLTTSGVLITRPGEPDVWIPRAELRGIRRATWTIDRAVEPGGLQLIEWMLGTQPVDTYLRLDDPSGFDTSVSPLISTERHPS